MLFKEVNRFCYRHVENIIDVFPLVLHVKHILFEALPMTRLANQRKISHKLHFYSDNPRSFALFAAAPFGIKRKVLSSKTLLPCEWLIGKKLANMLVGFHICSRVRASTLADRILIDKFYMFDLLSISA